MEDDKFSGESEDTMMDSAPDLTSEDDCRVLRRNVRQPERYNPSSGSSYHQKESIHNCHYSQKEITHNLITQADDPEKSFQYEPGEEKVLASIMQRLNRKFGSKIVNQNVRNDKAVVK